VEAIPHPVSWRDKQNQTETQIVVAVGRVVVVAVRNTAVVRVVVPTAAALHAIIALSTNDLIVL
jgi:hypothetical protein